MDDNAVHVPKSPTSPTTFDKNIGDAGVNRLGNMNANFPQDVCEQNMFVPSNIVATSNAIYIEGNDSNENEYFVLYLNYNDYLKCSNNLENKEGE